MVACVADKDAKRVTWMTSMGYLIRCAANFMADPKCYAIARRADRLSIARRRLHFIQKLIPSHWTPTKLVRSDRIPFAYLIVKGNCLDCRGQLICKTEHSHDREIVSDFNNPLKL